MRKKRSPIWTLCTEQLADLVARSTTFSDVLKSVGLNNIGGNCKTLQARLRYDGIDFSHIPVGRGSNRGRPKGGFAKKSLAEVMTEDSSYARTHLKERVIRENVIYYECSKCKNTGEWMGEKLVLVLDHINGVRDDHRKSNLRFLCPNCNSQTPTFCGKRKQY